MAWPQNWVAALEAIKSFGWLIHSTISLFWAASGTMHPRTLIRPEGTHFVPALSPPEGLYDSQFLVRRKDDTVRHNVFLPSKMQERMHSFQATEHLSMGAEMTGHLHVEGFVQSYAWFWMKSTRMQTGLCHVHNRRWIADDSMELLHRHDSGSGWFSWHRYGTFGRISI